MTPVWLYSCLGRLCLSDRKKFSEFEWADCTARKVGRNDVWRIQDGERVGDIFFAKFWSSRVYFQRELYGHNIMAELSASYPWIMSTKVLERNKIFGLIVTSMMAGTELSEIFKKGYRRDFALFGTHEVREEVAGGVRRVLDLIQCVQNKRLVSSNEVLFDYSVPAVVERINRRLEELKVLTQDKEKGMLPGKVEVPPRYRENPSTLVLGDVSFGNIFYDGNHIGVIDFEDLGVGPVFRDHMWIQYNLQEAQNKILYKKCSPLLSLVQNRMSDSSLQVIYRLDFALLVLIFLIKRNDANPFYKTCLEHSRRRRTYKDVQVFLRQGVECGVISLGKDSYS